MLPFFIQLFAIGCFAVLVFCIVKILKGDVVGARLREIEASDAPDMALVLDAAAQREANAKPRFNLHIPQKVKADIVESGIAIRTEEFVLIWISITLIPAVLYFTISNDVVFSICLVLVGAFLPPMYISHLKKKRREMFGTQLGDALMLISNGLRAGFSFEQVMESVCKDMPDPISHEFGRSIREMKMGMPMEDSLNAIADRTENVDMQLLTSAVMVQRKVGGNLADILDGLSETIRERMRIKRHIKTLTAQGRISGYIIGVLPIALFFIISGINPGYMEMLYTTTLGIGMLVVGGLMELTAILIIRKMVAL